MPFAKPTLDVRGGDGRNFTLLEPLVFTAKDGTVYRGIVGATTDGASTPQIGWNVFPPFGKYWLAAVLHDCAYRTQIEQQRPDGTWWRFAPDKSICDLLLLDAMESLGVDEATRQIIYQAVSKAGDSAFSDDLAQPIKF